jgi:hypothetical protein
MNYSLCNSLCEIRNVYLPQMAHHHQSKSHRDKSTIFNIFRFTSHTNFLNSATENSPKTVMNETKNHKCFSLILGRQPRQKLFQLLLIRSTSGMKKKNEWLFMHTLRACKGNSTAIPFFVLPQAKWDFCVRSVWHQLSELVTFRFVTCHHDMRLKHLNLLSTFCELPLINLALL